MKIKTLERKGAIKNGISRLAFMSLSFILETIFIVLLFTRAASYAEALNLSIRILSIVLVLFIYSKQKTSSLKMPWIILILAFPIIGTGVYLTIGLNGSTVYMRRKCAEVDETMLTFLKEQEDVTDELRRTNENAYCISRYLTDYGKYPAYHNEGVRYFKSAEEGLQSQIQDLSRAKSFIFMEYFAIANDQSWQRVEEVLVQKVKEGVEVRVFYDDVGSIGFVNLDFAKHLRSLGIKCKVFNPCIPGLKLILNHRDHRKMTIIDGQVAYTGGYNLTNEYFEVTMPYGRWKDTGIRFEGEAVRNLTISFLSMWLFERKQKVKIDTKVEVEPYLIDRQIQIAGGFIQPYADTPLDDEHVGEEVYISILNKATDYCYFITPYLIITDEMTHAMKLAAKRGVDVRIITPGIPDKKVIYSITRSFYHTLTLAGVQIYEWTPGFCHAKMCVADDRMATCGTINLDYRSLYHHFENGCFMVDCDAVKEIKADFDHLFTQSENVTAKYHSGRTSVMRLGQMFLRLFAELL